MESRHRLSLYQAALLLDVHELMALLLFITAPKVEPTQTSTSWITKMWSIHALVSFRQEQEQSAGAATAGTDSENVMLSERSQSLPTT